MKEKIGIHMAIVQEKHSSLNIQSSDYIPVRMVEVEIGQALPTLFTFDEKKEQYYQRARCLVRLHTQPLGLGIQELLIVPDS